MQLSELQSSAVYLVRLIGIIENFEKIGRCRGLPLMKLTVTFLRFG